MRGIFAFLLFLLNVTSAFGAVTVSPEGHGLSLIGTLKYPASFTHFSYANPNAPKGGMLTLHVLGSFDSLNPFILKGKPASEIRILYESLMTGSADEISSFYGLLAERAEVAPDISRARFWLRKEARWHDGEPITAEDVLFSYEILKTEGTPTYRLLLKDIKAVKIIDARTVEFVFEKINNRDLLVIAATLPILPKHYYKKVSFDKTTLQPPLGSGPYRVAKVNPGRSIVYERVKNYWGKDLPINRGHYNFDVIKIDYYRDRSIALEAFKAGVFDIQNEHTARSWANDYEFPAVKAGLVKLEPIPDQKPVGIQALFMNLRRDQFKDRRVREALLLAFDFEWLNKTVFYNAYKRIESIFENSPYAAHTPPSALELEYLLPLKDIIPKEVLAAPFKAPLNDAPGKIREHLKKASALLDEAGWHLHNGVRLNAQGKPLRIEFLTYEAVFATFVHPFIKNLRKLGIEAKLRVVDTSQYRERLDRFDFDLTTIRWPQPLLPGDEQRQLWGSASATLNGSPNISGIENKAVDILIEKLVAAEDWPHIEAAAKALDRVIMWNYYFIPAWYRSANQLAYWDKFGKPEKAPPFGNMVGSSSDSVVGIAHVWWDKNANK